MIWIVTSMIVFGQRMKHSWSLRFSMIRSISNLSEIMCTHTSKSSLKKKESRIISAKINQDQEYHKSWNYWASNTKLKWWIIMKVMRLEMHNKLLINNNKYQNMQSCQKTTRVNFNRYCKRASSSIYLTRRT